jgi:hypothetical protein
LHSRFHRYRHDHDSPLVVLLDKRTTGRTWALRPPQGVAPAMLIKRTSERSRAARRPIADHHRPGEPKGKLR